MTKEQLETRRDELAIWLADNLNAGNWEQVKDEYNQICYKLADLDFEISPALIERANLEYHIPPKSSLK